jgi:hypothetical protein
MRIPDEERYDFYGWPSVNSDIFDSFYWTLHAKSTEPRKLWDRYNGLAELYSDMAVVALDLDHSLEEVRGWLGQSARQWLEALRILPDWGPAHDTVRAFLGFALFRDDAACRALADAFTKSSLHVANWPKGKPPRVATMPHWSVLANVLVAHYRGEPLAPAVKLLEGYAVPAKFAAWKRWFEAMRALALHCATAKKPAPEQLLVAAAAEPLHRERSTGWWEQYFAQRPLAFACLARDRGWKPPEADLHPALPLRLLTLPRKKLPTGTLSRPSAAFKKEVKAMHKAEAKRHHAAKQ